MRCPALHARASSCSKRANLTEACALSCQIEILRLAALPAAVKSVQQLQQLGSAVLHSKTSETRQLTFDPVDSFFRVPSAVRPQARAGCHRSFAIAKNRCALKFMSVSVCVCLCLSVFVFVFLSVCSAGGFRHVDDVCLTGPPHADATRPNLQKQAKFFLFCFVSAPSSSLAPRHRYIRARDKKKSQKKKTRAARKWAPRLGAPLSASLSSAPFSSSLTPS